MFTATVAGALIAKVLPNSPAQKAGLQVGDIVRSVNGENIRSSSDLPVIVGTLKPGTEVRLEVWRQGKQVSLDVTLGSMGASVEVGQAATQDLGVQSGGQSFAVDEAGLVLGVQNSQEGTRLVVLRASGVAERAGLKRGDEIVAVSQLPVNDEATFRNALSRAGKNVPLLVQRGEDTLFLALSLP